MKKFVRAILLICALLALGAALAEGESAEVTRYCKYYTRSGDQNALHDSNMSTHVKLNVGGDVRVMFPDDGAGWLRVEWREPTQAYKLVEYDAQQQLIKETPSAGNFSALSQTFKLQDNTKYAFLIAEQPQSITELVVYSKGELPWNAMNWLPPYEDCDLLVFSTHQDDEWLWFGGLMPYYERVQGKKVQVVYMANCGRRRYNEALKGLWCGGLTHHPEMLGLKDERVNSFEQTVQNWGGYDEVVRILAGCIRRYKPEVIVVQDWNGEYGHNQHKVTSRAMQYAIEAAADPTRYPDSYEQYGAWQVQKLYRHLEKNCPITFDWDVPYPELNNHTPYETACIAYDQHRSQHEYYQMKKGGPYDNEKFGLSWSNVGEDSEHKDLFENIAPQASDELPAGESFQSAEAFEASPALPEQDEGNLFPENTNA